MEVNSKDRILALSTKVRLGWNCLSVTNTIAYTTQQLNVLCYGGWSCIIIAIMILGIWEETVMLGTFYGTFESLSFT
jgi:hypothetical protein